MENNNGTNITRATKEGRLYIKNVDFFKSKKVAKQINELLNSSIYKNIEKNKSVEAE